MNNSGVVYGGDDTINIVGAGNNVVVGGLGADTITTGAGNAIVLGDSGFATFDATGALLEIASDPVTTANGLPFLDLAIGSPNLPTSSNDKITLGNGNNVVIGGAGADQIVVGTTGANVIIGDDGEAFFAAGLLTKVDSIDGAYGIGGVDTITGPTLNGVVQPGGSGNNVVIGGLGGDTITLGGANNTIIGDDGVATFNQGKITSAATTDPGLGGVDNITVSGGNNVILGGTGGDTILVQGASSSGNVILGDDGQAQFTQQGVLSYITSTDQTDGGDDTITTGDGNNVVLGGFGADMITVGAGANVILGDNGDATFTSGVLTQIETIGEVSAATSNASSVESATTGTIYGGDDTILVNGNGNNVILGGLGADTITALGTGANVILGDSGQATFDPTTTNHLLKVLSTYAAAPVGGTKDTGTTSNDVITLGSGDNVVIGGAGSDQITLGPIGSEVIVGDDGEADFTAAGVLTTIMSTDDVYGAADTITGAKDSSGNYTFGGSGNSVVIGGLGGDTIKIGGANNTIIGDDGKATFDPGTGSITSVTTLDPFAGGNDTITVSGGSNVILGGTGADTITVQTVSTVSMLPSGNVILGDDGFATFTTHGVLTYISSSDQTDGGDDVITTGDGANTIFGGSGADQITVGAGANVILGDNGAATYLANAAGTSSVLTQVATVGELSAATPGVASVETNDPTLSNAYAGVMSRLYEAILHRAPDTGGLGFYEQQLASGYTVQDIANQMLGSGEYATDFGGQSLKQIVDALYLGALGRQADPSGETFYVGQLSSGALSVSGLLTTLATSPEAQSNTLQGARVYGGDDTILVNGNGTNVILGGLGADTITALGTGANVILGDSGQATFDPTTTNHLLKVLSTYAAAPVGGTKDTGTTSNDVITLGSGDNVVIGGAGSDQITLGPIGSEVIVGDDGEADFTAAGVLTTIMSTDDVYGAADTITGAKDSSGNYTFGGSGNSVVIGGLGGDTIKIGGANNTIIGDDGKATFDPGTGSITSVTTLDPFAGGNDTITVSGGSNVILGGTGADTITVQTVSTVSMLPSGNVILGDDGFATFTTHGVLTYISSSDQTDGGDDVITTGDGANTIFGGSGADQITVGAGANVILGDNGAATYLANAAGTSSVLTQVATVGELSAATPGVASVETNDPTLSNAYAGVMSRLYEAILHRAPDTGGLGFYEQQLASGYTVQDIANQMLGSGEYATDFGGQSLKQIVDALYLGALGRQADPSGETFYVGQLSSGALSVSGLLTTLATSPEAQSNTLQGARVYGGDDTILVNGNGTNVILGGLGADTITALGTGANVILGDSGQATFDPTTTKLVSIVSTYAAAPVGGTKDTGTSSNDVITVGNGNNVVFGGVGGDTIKAGDGVDTILGDDGQVFYDAGGNITHVTTTDYNYGGNDMITVGNGYDVVLGGTGSDAITAGNGNDYLFGDNALVQYMVIGTADVVTRAQSIAQGFGGDDTITAGFGNNAVVGGSGNDTIKLGDGDNLAIGDNGEIVQAFDANGQLVENSNGDLHRDIVLETIASVVASLPIGTASGLSATGLESAAASNLSLLAGAYNADGSKVMVGGVWQTDLLTLQAQADGNDSITVGNGANVVIGQGGSNTIVAGNGNNTIFGNAASNTSALKGDLPSIVNGYIISGAIGAAGLSLPGAGQMVVPLVNLQPYALDSSAPQLEMGPDGANTLSALAAGGTLQLGSGAHLTVFAAMQGGIADGSPLLAGNDTIHVGSGNNIIFGNYGAISSLTTTGITAIDAELSGVSASLLGLSTDLSTLAYVDDALRLSTGSSLPSISSGNDTITAGGGNNEIFGDSGRIFVTGAAPALPTGSLSAIASQYASQLVDVDQAIGDLSFAAHAATQTAINAFNALPSHTTPSVALSIGNDKITAGSGNSLVVGDNGIIIIPASNDVQTNWVSGQNASQVAAAQSAATSVINAGNAATASALAAAYPFAKLTNTGLLFGAGQGYVVSMDDNTIVGGTGTDVLVGNNALILQPDVTGGIAVASEASSAQQVFLTSIDRLYLGPYTKAAAYADAFGAQATLVAGSTSDASSGGGFSFSGSNVSLGDDSISTGNGNVLAFGDDAVIVPNVTSTTPGLMSQMEAYSLDEPGSTVAANFDYTAGFGAFGSLHQWAVLPVAPSPYHVDADSITGGSGTSVLYGGLGDDTINGGSGNEMISGGFGFNHVSGGGGTNLISFNRATDTYQASGGLDIARGTLDFSSNTSNLAATVSNPLTTTLASELSANVASVGAGENSWIATGTYTIPQTTPGLVLTASDITLAPGATIKTATLVSVTNTTGSPITSYQIQDRRLTGGTFTIGAATMSAAQTLTFTPAQFALSTFTAPQTGEDVLFVRATTGSVSSAWVELHVVVSSLGASSGSLARADGEDSDDDAKVVTASLTSDDDAQTAGDTIVAYDPDGSDAPVASAASVDRIGAVGMAPLHPRDVIRVIEDGNISVRTAQDGVVLVAGRRGAIVDVPQSTWIFDPIRGDLTYKVGAEVPDSIRLDDNAATTSRSTAPAATIELVTPETAMSLASIRSAFADAVAKIRARYLS